VEIGGNMERNWDSSFLKIARIISSHSTCIRKKVGALLVKDNRIISMGYNGVLPGQKHCEDIFKNTEDEIGRVFFMEEHNEFSRAKEVHAEQNCISYAAKYGIKTEGSCLYVTISPCKDCAKIIVASGIKKVVYLDYYDREPEGVDLLNHNNIKNYQGVII
jgi:dCMP deaminase